MIVINRYFVGLALSLHMATTAVAADSPRPHLPGDLAPALFPAIASWPPVVKVDAAGLALTSKEKLSGNVELRLRFRMTSPEDKGCSMVVVPGRVKPDDQAANPLHLSLGVYAGADPENLTWYLQPMPGKKDAIGGNYTIRNLPTNRLTWPDT